jgi:hypothetical protein
MNILEEIEWMILCDNLFCDSFYSFDSSDIRQTIGHSGYQIDFICGVTLFKIAWTFSFHGTLTASASIVLPSFMYRDLFYGQMPYKRFPPY